jgi:cell fate regulator YaaT (PSP1 superfamily)
MTEITQIEETTEQDTVVIKTEEKSNSEDDSRFKDGDEITLVRVRFPGNSRSFPFVTGKRVFGYGQKVIAMSDRGMDVGYINSFPYLTTFKKQMLPLRSIANVASEQDIREQQDNIRKQKEAESKANDLVRKLKLDMNITHVEITQFGKKMVFYFTAPARVDFRDLVKQLVGDLKIRIELRQISVRDRAASLGSIGACGQATCCSSFLKNYGNVTIKMAKNQNLALIPSKINGVCGQIKCCIKYEDDVYLDKRKLLPREGSIIKVANGDKGKVLKLHILIEQFDMMTDQGQIRRYARNQYTDKKTLDKKEFPERFKHIVNETSTVIGLTVKQKETSEQFAKNLSPDEQAAANIRSLKSDQAAAKPEDKTLKTSSNNQENDNSKPKKSRNNRNRNRNRNRKKKSPAAEKKES